MSLVLKVNFRNFNNNKFIRFLMQYMISILLLDEDKLV